MAVKRGLGRGLRALIKDVPVAGGEGGEGAVLRVTTDRIKRSPLQPRQTVTQESLEELANSIKERGVLEPLLVRQVGHDYELIAGERRLRASIASGLKDVPVIVMEANDQDVLEMALIENLQREGLNIIDEAEGYEKLKKKFGLTQEEIAAKVGKARASVANALRLLGMPESIRKLVSEGSLTGGHAKVLLSLDIAEEQVALAKRAARESLSVRNLEKLVEKVKKIPRKPRAKRDDIPSDHLVHLADVLHRHLGTSVRLSSCKTLANGKKAKGSLEIDFFSNDELSRIMELIGINEV